jgi:hypothetical protein
MSSDYINPISSVTAREILLPLLPESEPDINEAKALSLDLMMDYGLYVTVPFIMDVWEWREKHGEA